jgi:antitoxin component YwqK of YwqJK toxin-antitoxin module
MDSLNKILSLCLIVLCSCTYEKKNNSDYTQVENDLLIKKQDSLRIDSISKDTILIKYNGSTITHYKNFKITKEITKDSNSNTWFETIYKSQDDRVSIFYFPDGTIRDKYVTRNGREFIDYSVNQEFLREARINGYSINDTIGFICQFINIHYADNDSYRSLVFHANGKLQSEEVRINGKLSGTSREWFPNGQLYKEVQYSSNLINGRFRQYDTSGKITSEKYYVNNKIVDK